MKNAVRLAIPVLLLMAASVLAAEGEQHRELISLQGMEMIWSLATFVIFFMVLSVLVWPKILKGLQAREGKIRGDLQSAENAAKQAENTLKEYQQRLTAANDEVRKLIEKGRADAQMVAAQLKDQTEKEIAQMRQRAATEITSAKQQAVAELHAHAATLATEVAGRIIKRQINPADQQRLVEEAIGELRGAARRN